MSLLVTGSIGIDTVETPFGKRDDVLGGSAVYFSYAASFFTSVRLVGVVGDDWPKPLLDVFDGRDVDTLVEQVDREHRPYRAVGQVPEGGVALVAGTVTPHRYGRDAGVAEVVGHEAGVVDAHTEPEGPHRRRLRVACDLLHHQTRPRPRARVDVAQRFDVVAAAPSPRHLGEVESVVDSEVHERRELLLVDGVPEPQLGGNAVVEPVQDG